MEASLNGPSGNIALTNSALTIGRAANNALVLPDQQSSSHHAEIRPDAQGYVIVDLNSTNGTFVNEQPLAPQMPRLLATGDVIRIGATKFTYEMAGSYSPTMRASDFNSSPYQPTVSASPPPQSSYQDYQGYQNYQPQAQPPSVYGASGPGAQPSYPAYPHPAYQPPQQPQQPAYQPQPQPQYGAPPAQNYPQQAGFQQPWAAAPGQMLPQSPAAAPRKKSRAGLIIIVVLLLVIVGGVGGYFVLHSVLGSTPEKTLDAYCTALKNDDAQGVFNQLSTHAQSQTSVAKISAGLKILNSPLVGGIKTCTYSNVQENGSTATATITVTVGNPQVPTQPSKDILVNENGTWKLDSGQNSAPTS